MTPMPGQLQIAFVGGHDGPWRIDGITAWRGEPLPPAAHLAVVDAPADDAGAGATWALRGTVVGPAVEGSPEDTGTRFAALLALRTDSAADGLADALAQLPSTVGRIVDADGGGEPFDLLGWYELTADELDGFSRHLVALRQSERWTAVEREVEVRAVR